MSLIVKSIIAAFSLVLTFGGTGVFAQKSFKQSKKSKILIISDLNSAYGSVTYSSEVHQVINKISRIKPDLILVAGDMVAGQKRSLTEIEIQNMWDAFDAQIFQKIKTFKIPFAFTIGNHDASPSFLIDRALADKFWKARKSDLQLNFVDDSNFPFYYSFVHQNNFIISWDASSAKIPDSIYSWMHSQLNKPEAKSAMNRFVLGHLPLYAIVEAKNKNGEVNNDPNKAIQFFKDNHVDMYISGHQHAYYPALKDEVFLFHAGAIGDGPRPFIGSNLPAQKAFTIFKLRKHKGFKFYTINPSTNKQIKLAELPTRIDGFNGSVNKYSNK